MIGELHRRHSLPGRNDAIQFGDHDSQKTILRFRWNRCTKGRPMRTRAGLWIDHKKAIVVAVTDKGEETALIVSKVETHPQRSGDSPRGGRYESQKVPADDIRQRVLTGHLNIYYEAVIACLRDAEFILLFGPGEAKGELARRLERSKLRGRIVGNEAADKMTTPQIAAKVRRFFAEQPSAVGSVRHRSNRSSSEHGRPLSFAKTSTTAWEDLVGEVSGLELCERVPCGDGDLTMGRGDGGMQGGEERG